MKFVWVMGWSKPQVSRQWVFCSWYRCCYNLETSLLTTSISATCILLDCEGVRGAEMPKRMSKAKSDEREQLQFRYALLRDFISLVFWELRSVQICMWSPVMLLLWVFLCTLPNPPVTGFYFWVQDLWTFKTWVLLEYLERLHSSSERLLILFTPTVDHALSDCFMKVQQQKEGFYQVSMTRIV